MKAPRFIVQSAVDTLQDSQMLVSVAKASSKMLQNCKIWQNVVAEFHFELL